MLKSYLNINNIPQFIKSIKELQPEYYDSRQFRSGLSLSEADKVLYRKNPKTFYKHYFLQTPTKHFFHLIALLDKYEKNPSLHLKKKISLSISTYLKINYKNKVNGTWPFTFCSITRSIEINFDTNLDLFFILLWAQLLLKNFFTSVNEWEVSQYKKKQSFCLIQGSQLLNPYYNKKKIYSLNETFFFGLKYQCQNFRFPNDYNLTKTTTLDFNSELSIKNFPIPSSSFWGIKLYLNDNYFDDLLWPLKKVHTNVLKLNTLNSGCEYTTNSSLKQFFYKGFWDNQQCKWKKASKWTQVKRLLVKDTLYYTYGISRRWTKDLNFPTNREALIRFSQTLVTGSNSPFFYFSLYRYPIYSWEIYPELSDDYFNGAFNINQSNKVSVYFPFFNAFAETYKNNVYDYYLRTKVLHFLKKKQKNLDPLTGEDYLLNLKIFGFNSSSDGCLLFKRSPLVFYQSLNLDSSGLRYKFLNYKRIIIRFDRKNFSISIIGPKKKLKTIFLIASLYWTFKDTIPPHSDTEKLLLRKIFLTKSTSHKNKILYLQTDLNPNLKKDFHNISLKNSTLVTNLLDEVFFTRIIQCQKKKNLSLNLILHPKTFLYLSKMVLTSNDKRTLTNFSSQHPFMDLYEWVEDWDFPTNENAPLYSSTILK